MVYDLEKYPIIQVSFQELLTASKFTNENDWYMILIFTSGDDINLLMTLFFKSQLKNILKSHHG